MQLFTKLQIDYRTQAKAVGHPVVVSNASRALTEPDSRRAARAEMVRRHGPIRAIWVVLVKRFIYPVANPAYIKKLLLLYFYFIVKNSKIYFLLFSNFLIVPSQTSIAFNLICSTASSNTGVPFSFT